MSQAAKNIVNAPNPFAEKPSFTYFETKYKDEESQVRNSFEIPFDELSLKFGGTYECTIPPYGDILTGAFVRATLPPIYPTQTGAYVYPGNIAATLYVDKLLTLVVADGVNLYANVSGSHFFSVGAKVILSGTNQDVFALDGEYTITSIPTANSFVCSTPKVGFSYTGYASSPGIQPAPVVSYYSTQNINLWAEVPVNLGYTAVNGQITDPIVNLIPGQTIYVFSSPTGTPVQGTTYTVATSSANTFTLVDQSFGSSVFLAFDNVYPTVPIYVSYDGLNWIAASLGFYRYTIVGYGNGLFVAITQHGQQYLITSTDGLHWSSSIPFPYYTDYWYDIAYGNGLFVVVGNQSVLTSPDGISWTYHSVTSGYGTWYGVAYGNGLFVAAGASVIISSNGINWISPPGSPFYTGAESVVYLEGLFIICAYGLCYTSPDGINWTSISISAKNIAYGNGVFVASGYGVYTSPDAITWTYQPDAPYGTIGVAFGKGIFASLFRTDPTLVTSTDGINWSSSTLNWLFFEKMKSFENPSVFSFAENAITVTYDPVQNKFVFSSVVYPSITFTNAQDAAFWGFDYLQGPSFPFVNGQLTSQWTLTQGGWITGFLPPSTSAYADSVANKLIKEARVLVGRQVVKKYTGEYLELVNDLKIPYENKAILKLMNGTLDQTQAVASREYYVPLPLGCEEIPLCALTRQKVSFQIDFEEYQNLSNDLNKGSGDFFDPESYLTYNVSQNLLGGQTFNVASTLSYRQYILIFTTDGTLLIYDTSKPIDDSGSYQVISAFAGQTSAFVNSVILGTTLFIQLLDGHILGGNLDELIDGNTSSFEINDYLPMSPSDAGPPTGTMVCDARYLYYAQKNSSSNVFFVRYDTRTSLQNLSGYTAFNFTSNISSSATSVYQILSTGSQLIALTNTPGTLYSFPILGNFLTDWFPISWGSGQVTEGVVVGVSVYFILYPSVLLKYSNGQFYTYSIYVPLFLVMGELGIATSYDGTNWTLNTPPFFNQYGAGRVTYGNGIFVVIDVLEPYISISADGVNWVGIQVLTNGYWNSVTYGNGLFVAVGGLAGSNPPTGAHCMTSPDGINWTIRTVPGEEWRDVVYGNGLFVAIGSQPPIMTSPDGINWTGRTAPGFGISVGRKMLAYGNGVFVAVSEYSVPPAMIISHDGIYWTEVDVSQYMGPYNTGFISLSYANGLFFGSTYGSVVIVSSDGVNWSLSSNLDVNHAQSVLGANGLFVAVGASYISTSTDANTWSVQNIPFGYPGTTTTSTKNVPNLGPLRNLHAVGTTIYASANTSSQASIIQIDTTKDLSTSAAYKYYSSSGTSPISFAGNVPTIFANGPRYVYMFTNDLSETTNPTNAIRYDPYPPNKTLIASVIADYKVLPSNVPKPTDATIKYLQTQHVTGMNFADLQVLGPVKELYVTGTANTTNVYQYSNLEPSVSLTITGNEQILTPDVGTQTALQTIAPFQTHTTMPVRNFSVIPFEVNPESQTPNGTVNFSRLYYQQLSNGASLWATTYNILNISSGIGGLEFNSPY